MLTLHIPEVYRAEGSSLATVVCINIKSKLTLRGSLYRVYITLQKQFET